LINSSSIFSALAPPGRGIPPKGVAEPGDLRQPGSLAVGDAVSEAGLKVVGEVVQEFCP
jgi:hypothetical protein